jgi:hypothetical protein
VFSGKAGSVAGSPVVTSRGFNQPSASRCRRDFSRASTSLHSASFGGRDVQSRNAYFARSVSSLPASFRTRIAKARAASTKIVSFRPVKAASGVFERTRRAQEKSPFGASKVGHHRIRHRTLCGIHTLCGDSVPDLWQESNNPDKRSCSPGRSEEPAESLRGHQCGDESSPAAVNAMSRTTSASARNRGPRANS